MSHVTKELADEMEGSVLRLHFQWKPFLLGALFPGSRKQPAVTALPLISVSSLTAN